MKSYIFAWFAGAVFTLFVFFGGLVSGFYLNQVYLANTYTEENVDNGRFMLWALKMLDEGETEKAKSFLRSQVTTKVLIVDGARLPPTSERELKLIKDFYLEVINYFDSQGGLNETWQVKENDVWVTKPTPSMQILEEFKNEHNK